MLQANSNNSAAGKRHPIDKLGGRDANDLNRWAAGQLGHGAGLAGGKPAY